MFPVLSEAVTGSKITVSAPYFNRIMVPIGLALMALTGIGPLLAWRHTSGRSLVRHFAAPTLVGLATAAGLIAGGVRDVYALISFGLCALVTATIVSEFHRGAMARRSSSGESYLAALRTLTLRNKRRYGGYVVHFGFVLLFIGFTGTAFNAEADAKLRPGESVQIRSYVLTYKGQTQEQNESAIDVRAWVGVQKEGETLGTMKPGILIYYKRPDQQRATEVAIRSTLREDLYAILEGQGDDGVVFLRIHVNPLVAWVWIGGFVMTFGMIVVMWPDRGTDGRGREEAPAEVQRGKALRV
jgi:cytochrome c-type biogenesis protein CcmF